MSQIDQDTFVCANLCNLSYEDRVDSLVVETFKTLGLDVSKSEFIDGNDSVALTVDENGRLFISWMGTADVDDVLQDAEIELVPLFINGEYCGKVHYGLHSYYATLRDDMNQRVSNFVKSGGHHVIFTGFSLGASITYSALECVMNHPEICVRCVTFGSPRSGDKLFADTFNVKVPNSTRVIIDDDFVPRLPWGFGYTHVGNALVIKSNRTFSWFKILWGGLLLLAKKKTTNNMAVDHFITRYITVMTPLLQTT